MRSGFALCTEYFRLKVGTGWIWDTFRFGTGCDGKPTEFFMHALTKLDITYNYYYNIHTMQFIMENYDLVVYNVPKNPNPLTAQHNILTTYSEMTKVHLNQI